MNNIQGLQSHPANFWSHAKSPDEKQFRMQHQLRHAAYDSAASISIGSLAGLDLSGEINKDWLFRHASRHATYRVIVGKSGASPTCDLSSLNWKNISAVQAWMQYHAQLHADLDAFFGLKS